MYGLNVGTNIELPVPLGDLKPWHVAVRLEEQTHPLQQAGDQHYYFSVSPEFAQFQYRDVAIYTMRQGQEISIAPLGDVDPALIINTLLGTALGILLLQRRYLVLHASAVQIVNRSVCFVGSSGAGKSTTACSLVSSGHQLISDDVVAFNLSSNSKISPLPAYPWMKVGKKCCEELNLDDTLLSELQQFSPKKRYNMAEAMFAKEPEELQCIYILTWGERLSIEAVKPKDAVFSLLANAYGFVPSTSYPQEEKERFLQLTKFVQDVPCFTLQRPQNIDSIVAVGSAVEEHLSTFI